MRCQESRLALSFVQQGSEVRLPPVRFEVALGVEELGKIGAGRSRVRPDERLAAVGRLAVFEGEVVGRGVGRDSRGKGQAFRENL